ncbi:MAG: sulfur carrier protein ThiS [Verrucomicrobiaceae bacterium]|jgi:sulfur carrier protein|nr:sulfur carrier protein ThiS [Verrucomicrobiaceae bacterium]
MKIKLNGKDHSLNEATNVETLLASIGLAGKPVIVELNKKALFPREYADSDLQDNDQLEIITIAAGG